ncbi:efflux transporter outer membrane subunit [Stenotrophomonas sp. S41]|uniref:efflux transporter outer membrane subunit n=1 Tax=Stenotrophomonas sp. S41 TaxID=2767464 RepID=UPI001909B635|nr:efflux transporter outer membrane subunit [Stenotrophomonas sp. S41]MBK0010769.1 efflux transporter outer membrane subunit [Stenotrophomonas sp. S41]
MNTLPKHLALAILAALTASCTSLAPPVPGIEVPEASALINFAGNGESREGALSIDTLVRSDQLRRLIRAGVVNNRDLRAASLNMVKVREMYRIQGAELYPQLDLFAQGSSARAPSFGTEANSLTRTYGAGVSIASWELDLFGRIRSLKDAALERYLASDATRRSVELALISQIASSYLQLASDQQQLALADQTYTSRVAAYELQKELAAAGISSSLEINRAAAELEEIGDNLLRWKAAAQQTRNGLQLLVGTNLDANLTAEPIDQILADDLPIGHLSSAVLASRPDVKASEHELLASNADIGAARAAFFPSISLTGAYGSQSGELSSLFESGSKSWSFIPQVTLPIFSGGRLRASLRATTASRDIALAHYEGTVQTAFREVSDVLVDRSVLGDRVASRKRQVKAANASLDAMGDLYTSGVATQIELLDAQRTLFAAESALITISLQQRLNAVDLYRVLGGGRDNPMSPTEGRTELTKR